MRNRFKLGDQVVTVELISSDPLQVQLVFDEVPERLDFPTKLAPGEGRLRLRDRTIPYFVTAAKNGTWVSLAGQTWFFEKAKKNQSADQGHGGFGAPMPGKVTRVQVTAGQEVEQGQVLVIMEAMKMEHRIEAPGAGTVTAIHCQVDQLVDQDFQLLEFQPRPE